MRVLAIHAHPDDIEILCAGTLAHLQNAGHEIFMTTMTAGDKGSPNQDRNEIAAIRRQEAAQSAQVLNAVYTCLEMRDLEILDSDANRRAVTRHFREAQPDMVITASPVDYMADHETTAALVRHAAFAAGVRNYECGNSNLLGHIPTLYYMDPIEGKDHFGQPIAPDFCIDITDTMPQKEKMLNCHASQREWLRAHHGLDHYVESMKEWSAFRGQSVGVQYAEGFRQHKGHAFPLDNQLAALIPESFIMQTVGFR